MIRIAHNNFLASLDSGTLLLSDWSWRIIKFGEFAWHNVGSAFLVSWGTHLNHLLCGHNLWGVVEMMHLWLQVRLSDWSICWNFILLLLWSWRLPVIATWTLMFDATDICTGSFFLDHICCLKKPLCCRLLLHIFQCVLKLQRENAPEDSRSRQTCTCHLRARLG